MELKCLGTGSSGNCYLVCLDGSYIILDAGVNFKKIVNEVSLNLIDFAFISHEHKDHSRSLQNLVSRRVNILYGNLIQEFTKSEFKSKFSGLYQIYQFPVEHGDCKCAGIIIKKGNECILYVTDFTICKYDLSVFKFTSVIVECNYLKEKAENTEANEFLRVKENIYRHLSLEGCDLFLSRLDLSKCKEIFLIHFSDNFSDPIYSGSYISNKYHITTHCCKKNGGYDTYE